MSTILLTCAYCNVPFERERKEFNRSTRLGRPSYCSLSCNALARESNKERPKIQVAISPRLLYWLAGLLDGEGSFFRLKGEDKRAVISLQMSDFDTVEKAANIFDVSYIQKILPNNPKHKTTYSVRVRGGKAEAFMKLLHPLMSNRRKEQIDKVLN